MALSQHPIQGSVVVADYGYGFQAPEMVKRRLVVVLSPAIKARPGPCTVVALSTTPPNPVMPYHAPLEIPFALPPPRGERTRWIKGDMVNAAGLHRVDLLRLGKDRAGRRIYQTAALPADAMTIVRRCVLHGLGLSGSTKHLPAVCKRLCIVIRA